ncbi:hypothetical protein MPH_12793 [Macrophomina phaseolina MS6]|uniref:Uncharacterized protein n=1 Tax=Macrophomina phaseolina (strain MS6) TaxID=1126212 RepID=K2R7D0_MACPH|nr:hypothetical protein MPH_12793 [Macrophomina phaseolina MS6]
MSTQRWERRKLSSPRYEYEALELLAKTLAVFEYLNDPKVQQVMRVLHNRISEELRGFEAAVNEARLRKGQPQIPLMELWDDYTSIFAGGITQMRHAMGVGPFPFQLEYFMVLRDQADANKAVRGKDPKKRTKLFGPPPREEKPEPWVQILAAQLKNAENNAEDGTGGFGFVVYRWKEYEGVPWEKVEKAITGDLMNWGEGMVGVGQLKPKAKLQWVEMAGASMENYRMHFQTLRESEQLETGIRHDVFLVIDPHAANAWFPTHLPAEAAHVYAERHRSEGHSGIMTMSSTRSTALGAMPTDFEPWVLAVDPDFGQTNASTATGSSSPPSIYAGWLRMQSSLVFEELYGLAESGILAMEELWKMAASHPCGVYTGVLTEVEIRRFDEWTMLRNRAIKWVLDRPDTMFYGRR